MTPRLAAIMGPTVTFRIDGASASLVSATFSPSACWTHIGTVKHKSPGLQHVLVSHRATNGVNKGSLNLAMGISVVEALVGYPLRTLLRRN
jgi:hypothetical protein